MYKEHIRVNYPHHVYIFWTKIKDILYYIETTNSILSSIRGQICHQFGNHKFNIMKRTHYTMSIMNNAYPNNRPTDMESVLNTVETAMDFLNSNLGRKPKAAHLMVRCLIQWYTPDKWKMLYQRSTKPKYNQRTLFFQLVLNRAWCAVDYLILQCTQVMQHLDFPRLVNTPDKTGTIPLMLIVSEQHGNEEIASTILRNAHRFVYPLQQDHRGITLLHYCLIRSSGTELSRQMLRLLQRRRPDSEHEQRLISDALCSTVWKSRTDATKILIESNVLHNFNIPDKRHCTPLMYAAYKGMIDISNLLIQRGAIYTYQDNHDRTSLGSAIAGGQGDVVTMLLERHRDDGVTEELLKSDNMGRTPLMLMCSTGMVEQTKLLLELVGKHSDYINEQTIGGQTALYYAAAEGNKELCELLLSRGATANADSRGIGPIRAAKDKEFDELAEYIEEQVKPPVVA